MTESGSSPPRLKDVAARAGVSTATVSRVLHQNGYASADARERVKAALQESGYRLNAVAQGLRKQRTITLGLILHGILPNPFFAEVAMGAEHAAAEEGFNVLIFNTRGDGRREQEGVETLLSRRVDGIIFTTALERKNVQLAVDAGVSVVEVERPLSRSAASVVVDNYAGALEAMEYLLELGHQGIGYLGNPYALTRDRSNRRADKVVKQRFDAYRDALRSAGLELNTDHVVLGEYPHYQGGSGGLETGARYMEQLLTQSSDITAVFASSDLLAAGALHTLYRRGIQVPDRMSLVGFDDTVAEYLAPPLTTVRQPMFEMGLKAASLAIKLLSERPKVAPTESCSTTLVVRDSTRAPRHRPIASNKKRQRRRASRLGSQTPRA